MASTLILTAIRAHYLEQIRGRKECDYTHSLSIFANKTNYCGWIYSHVSGARAICIFPKREPSVSIHSKLNPFRRRYFLTKILQFGARRAWEKCFLVPQEDHRGLSYAPHEEIILHPKLLLTVLQQHNMGIYNEEVARQKPRDPLAITLNCFVSKRRKNSKIAHHLHGHPTGKWQARSWFSQGIYCFSFNHEIEGIKII